MVAWFLGWAVLVFYFVNPVLDTGRDRFWSVCLSAALVIIGGFWARQGPEHLRMPRLLLWLLRSPQQQPAFFQVSGDSDAGDDDSLDGTSATEQSETEVESPEAAPASPEV